MDFYNSHLWLKSLTDCSNKIYVTWDNHMINNAGDSILPGWNSENLYVLLCVYTTTPRKCWDNILCILLLEKKRGLNTMDLCRVHVLQQQNRFFWHEPRASLISYEHENEHVTDSVCFIRVQKKQMQKIKTYWGYILHRVWHFLDGCLCGKLQPQWLALKNTIYWSVTGILVSCMILGGGE